MKGDAESGERGLTIRSFVVCIVALLVMGVWIEYEELYCRYGGPLAENSPANSAVGVIWALIGVSAVLYMIRRSLRLRKAELVVIYSALILASPLMTQGLWHRIFGLVAAIPHNQDFKSYESLPPMLWPHGDNLVRNNRFENGLEDFEHRGGGDLRWEDIDRGTKGVWKSPVLSNGGDPDARASLVLSVRRYDESGREVLVPGEKFLFSMLAKADGFTMDSFYFVRMQVNGDRTDPLLINAERTKQTFANPGGFRRVGVNPVMIPRELDDRLDLHIGISGEGSLAVQDIEFFNVEAIEGAYSGRGMVREQNLSGLDEDERGSLVVKPDNILSWSGLKYLLTGYIPLRQWIRPLIAWSILIGALFLGFMGINILMRKQWAENEHFTFPLTIVPRNLFAEVESPDGEIIRPIFRSKAMWLGFAFTLPLVLLKGANFYNPSIPAPVLNIAFSDYVTSPLLKTYLSDIGTGQGIVFCLLSIALLIETDILFSLWSMFLLFRLWPLFGKVFSWNRFPGYPWHHQQGMGGYIGYALLAVYIGRHHIWKVLKIIAGRGAKEDIQDGYGEVSSYRTAFLMIVVSIITVVCWSVWTRMGAFAGLLFFGYMLVCGFTASKIRAECGAPYGYMTPYFGMQFVAAVGGFAVFKSTGMLVSSIAAGFMCTACFLLIAPVQVEMMELGRHFGVRPRDVGSGLLLGLLGGLLIGGFVLLCWMYGFGANDMETTWPYEQDWYFNGGFRGGELDIDRAFEAGTVGTAPETRPLNFIGNPDAKGLGIGAGITIVLAVLRSAFVWFPFHPLGYVVASTYMMIGIWFMVFIAWLIRLIVFRLGGARTIRHGLVPFCVGMFLACIASILIFDVVGVYMRVQGFTEVYAGMP